MKDFEARKAINDLNRSYWNLLELLIAMSEELGIDIEERVNELRSGKRLMEDL